MTVNIESLDRTELCTNMLLLMLSTSDVVSRDLVLRVVG